MSGILQKLKDWQTELIVGGFLAAGASLVAAWHFYYKPLQEKREALEYYKQARQEFDRDNHDAAIELFTKSLKKNRKFYKTLNNRGTVYLKVKRHEAALEDAEESLRLLPTANGHMIKGRALMGLGRYEEAIAAFQECAGFPDATEHNKQYSSLFTERCRSAMLGRGGLPDLSSPPPAPSSKRNGSPTRRDAQAAQLLSTQDREDRAKQAEEARKKLEMDETKAQTPTESKRNNMSSSQDLQSSTVLVNQSQILSNSTSLGMSGVLVEREDATPSNAANTQQQNSNTQPAS